ncbi:MAG: hypothetical protein DHS20C20_29430 [Ardenticatenaceae bacterium]|nr:MAG: hypothetical protein DHS20C20_29430 [Ardenticatenaceae bacterium]
MHITYANAGTRSEGQHGELSHNGRSIQPTHEGQERDTPLGRLKYYLHPDKATLPFAITGWNFANRKRIRPSTFTYPVLTPTEQDALHQIARSFRNFNELFHAIDRGFEKEGNADLQREKKRIIEATAVLSEETKARLPLLTAAITAQTDLSNRYHHYLNELMYQFSFLEQSS